MDEKLVTTLQSLLQKVDAMTLKLGVSMEQLWALLIRQCYINAISDALFVIVLIGLFTWWTKLVINKTTQAEDEYGRMCAEWDEEGAFGAWALVIIFGGITLIVACYTLNDVFTALFNPGYFAFNKLMP